MTECSKAAPHTARCRLGRIALMFAAGGCMLALAPAALAAPNDDIASLRAQIAGERASLERQQRELDAQRQRLQALEDNLLGQMRGTGAGPQEAGSGTVPLPPSPPAPATAPARRATASAPASELRPVGQAPVEQRQVQVAVLAEQGGVITSRGRLTIEPSAEYAHADRNRTIFRGIELPAAVLIGVFDINESRQDVITGGLTTRLGLTNRLEINARTPLIYRSDKSVLAPVSDPSTPNSGQINRAVHRVGLGDVEFGARYQFTDGRNGFPYLIAGIQAVAPTGSNPFTVRRDNFGNALRASTGSGFWGVSPTLTAILPTDPAVLFGTLGYTYNFGRTINRMIGQSFIERVKPLGEPSASLGMAISLNTRASISFGYAHTWSMGTRTRIRTANMSNGMLGAARTTTTRDLQLGRLLIGMSYRATPRTTINWNVEVGATDDATDVRTTLRIPLNLRIF